MERKNSHGGSRKKLTWEEKKTIVEPEKVEHFVQVAICGCDSYCMKQLRRLGEGGREIVTKLRESRLAGDFIYLLVITLKDLPLHILSTLSA